MILEEDAKMQRIKGMGKAPAAKPEDKFRGSINPSNPPQVTEVN